MGKLVIRKYSHRRLYCTSGGQYVNLEEELKRTEVQVIDAKSAIAVQTTILMPTYPAHIIGGTCDDEYHRERIAEDYPGPVLLDFAGANAVKQCPCTQSSRRVLLTRPLARVWQPSIHRRSRCPIARALTFSASGIATGAPIATLVT